jgi:polysaccharide export outer membrane protein
MKRRNTILFLTIWIIVALLITGANAQDKKTNAASAQSKTPKGEIAADSDAYTIGPEDVLNIYVWKEESLTKTVPVRIDGKISLPLVDDIQAAGLTPLKLKDVITQKLKNFIDNPTVTITVIEANSYRIYVSGEVKNPGIMRIRSQTTLLKTIIAVGGFTEWANKRKILIITREGGQEKRIIVNYNKIVDGDEPDIAINPGDTIIVK